MLGLASIDACATRIAHSRRMPRAGDDERYTESIRLSMILSDMLLAMMTRGIPHGRVQHDCFSTAFGSWRNSRV
jgi:hypothetical protein